MNDHRMIWLKVEAFKARWCVGSILKGKHVRLINEIERTGPVIHPTCQNELVHVELLGTEWLVADLRRGASSLLCKCTRRNYRAEQRYSGCEPEQDPTTYRK